MTARWKGKGRGRQGCVWRRDFLLEFSGKGIVMGDRQRDAAQVHAERAGVEAGVHKKTSHAMGSDRLAIDGGDQDSEMPTSVHAFLATRAEEVGETGGDLGAFRLVGGK